MKTKIVITAILLTISFLNAQAQSDMFEKLSNHRDVTSVYISKTLLGMVSNFNTGGADIRSLAGKLEQIEIYNSNGNREANQIIRDGVDSLTRARTYEVLMRVRDGESNTDIVFYGRKERNHFRDLIMHITLSNNVTIIRIMGNFTAEDIQKVMDSTNINNQQ
jgi:hypothetical protein